MAQQKTTFRKTLTPKFRVSFANVFVPKAVIAGGDLKYSVTMLFDKKAQESAEYKKMKSLAQEALIEYFGTDKTKWPKNLKNPFRDAKEKEYQGYDDGVIFVSCSTKEKPGLVNEQKQTIIDKEEFYSGCYAVATVSVYAYQKAGNSGVAFGLNNIMKLGDGEKFSGRTRAEDDFADVKADETLENSEFASNDMEW